MQVSLARDPNNNSFEVPEGAAHWRVRRHTGGRPSTVVCPNGTPLFVPIDADRVALRSAGCSGSLRLEAVDADHEPVDAPVAFVELGESVDSETPRQPASFDQSELVRSSFDSMTRTMEAMQRAQVERERALSQREKSITDVQVATSRMHVDIITAVLDRLGGGKQPDPLAFLKQQAAFQKTLAETARNAGMVHASEIPAPTRDDSDEKDESTKQPQWLQTMMAMAPMLISMFAKDDPAKAAFIQQALSVGVNAVTQAQSKPEEAEAPSRPTPRAIRQVLAELNDEEADRFETLFVNLDAAGEDRLSHEAASLPPHHRATWARLVMERAQRGDAGPALPIGVPTELGPLLAQLSADELQTGAQLIAVLDEATTKRLASTLLSMPQDKALLMIKRLIDDSRRRSASVAQRAAATVLEQVGVVS